MKRTRITRIARILNTDNKWMNTDFKHRDMELRSYTEITKHRDMKVRRYTEMKREKEEKEERREKELALRALIKAKPLCFSRLLHTFKPCVSVFKPAFNLRKSALICVSKWRNPCHPCHPCHPCPFLFSIFLFSCTKATLSYPGTGADANIVGIYPDRVLPAMEYRFYAPDTCLVRSDDGKGNFRGELPEGVYRVRAVNADAGEVNVEFGGLDGYETAAVGARSVQPPMSDTYTLVDTVGDVYTVHEELEVTGYGPVERRPSPELLTRRLVLVFTFAGGLETEVVSLAGVLPGVFPSVLLSTGLPATESVDRSTGTAVRFGVSGEGAQRTVRVGLFGLRDPQEGQYTNTLVLTLAMNDGRQEKVAVDLTGTLSEIIAGNQGLFPPLVYMIIELKTETEPPDVGGISGSVTAWGLEDGQTIYI